MNIRPYLDSTYLKTASQAELDENENLLVVKRFIREAIDEKFKLLIVLPDMVSFAKKMITDSNSKVQIGAVIGFPEGKSRMEDKLEEAIQAIQEGTDDLDFVCNYEAYKSGNVNLVKEEVLKCTQLGLENNKVIKWIIEVAALNDKQIMQLSALVKNVVISNFMETNYSSVFVKSFTGFYKNDNDLPNDATIATIILMLENASPLPVKAAGGLKTYDEVINMIRLGVKRIGTSSAIAIANNGNAPLGY